LLYNCGIPSIKNKNAYYPSVHFWFQNSILVHWPTEISHCGVQQHPALMECSKINCKHETTKNEEFSSTLTVELFSLLKDLFSYRFFSSQELLELCV